MNNYKITIFGRVQGILFRKFIQKTAIKNNIKGIVRNLKDGSVQIIINTTNENLNIFIKKIKKYNLAIINNLQVEKINLEKEFTGFKIIKTKNYISDKISAIKNLINYYTKYNITRNHLKIIPNHIVIIPDGNRRWAKKIGMSGKFGHSQAINGKRMESFFLSSKKLGIKNISLWGFSTENWSRDKDEIEHLWKIFHKSIDKIEKYCIDENIKFNHIGRKTKLPKDLLEKIKTVEKNTKKKDNIGTINLLLDYGGEEEILEMVNKLKDKKTKITSDDLYKNLYTKDLPMPDMIIRTSGEQRLSGIFPLQSRYAELFFVKKTFPEFTNKDFEKLIYKFQFRKRRFGGN